MENNNTTLTPTDAAREFIYSKYPHLRHKTEGSNPVVDFELNTLCEWFGLFSSQQNKELRELAAKAEDKDISINQVIFLTNRFAGYDLLYKENEEIRFNNSLGDNLKSELESLKELAEKADFYKTGTEVLQENIDNYKYQIQNLERQRDLFKTTIDQFITLLRQNDKTNSIEFIKGLKEIITPIDDYLTNTKEG